MATYPLPGELRRGIPTQESAPIFYSLQKILSAPKNERRDYPLFVHRNEMPHICPVEPSRRPLLGPVGKHLKNERK